MTDKEREKAIKSINVQLEDDCIYTRNYNELEVIKDAMKALYLLEAFDEKLKHIYEERRKKFFNVKEVLKEDFQKV